MLKPTNSVLLFSGALFAVAAASQFVRAQVQSEMILALNDNDGIFVDKMTFKAFRGKGQKSDPVTLTKLGAKEVSAGAIIYRSGDKLYVIDGTPPANASPQFMKDLQDWCPTCSWYDQNKGSYMK
jgi:hypothetical protein